MKTSTNPHKASTRQAGGGFFAANMNKAIARPRTPAKPIKIEMIWGFYVNTTQKTFFAFNADEALAEGERQGCIKKHGSESVSDLMKKPKSHLEKISARENHVLIAIGEV